jgi:hypothetical protein
VVHGILVSSVEFFQRGPKPGKHKETTRFLDQGVPPRGVVGHDTDVHEYSIDKFNQNILD